MSLYNNDEICRKCIHAVFHKCCNSFCHCIENKENDCDFCSGQCDFKIVKQTTTDISSQENIDVLEISDIRNKLSPIKNLIAIIEKNNIIHSDENINSFLLMEIENCKISIEYLSGKTKTNNF